jgi:prolipoprotein diacylglyceryl transferase
MRAALLLSIPSPGPWGRQYRLYGIMIALGVILGLELARKRWAERGGDPEDMSSIAMWAVPAGLVGARLYHVITDRQLYYGHWFDPLFDVDSKSPLAIWNGGLGIPGGILAGVLVGVYLGRRKGIRLPVGLDAVAPCLPLAQAIGRWGNYFNVELFGRPTTLPWGLEVPDDVAARAGYPPGLTFHPTFLYEMLWNVALVAFIIWIGKRKVLRPGRLFALYVGGYFLGRLWVEALRADEANTYFGLRVNIWISLVAIAGTAIFLAVRGLRRRPGDSDEPYRDGHRFGEEASVRGDERELADDDAEASVAQRASGGDDAMPDAEP